MITRVRNIYLPALASFALLLGGTAMFAQGEANKKPEPVEKAATSTMTDTEFAKKAAEAKKAMEEAEAQAKVEGGEESPKSEPEEEK